MNSGSIVRQATATARRVALVALLGAAAIVAGFFAERAYFQEQIRAATARLVAAHGAADRILLADERLTMSATIAATTGEKRWIDRYEANIPIILDAIREAVSLAPPEIAARFDAETRVANDRLVALERQAFAAVQRGDTAAARAMLESPAYTANKDTLSAGTKRFVNAMIAAVAAERIAVQRRAVLVLCFVLLASIAGAALLWRILDTTLAKSERALFEAERKIQTLAMNDLLTGLANRVSLREALHAAIGRANRNRGKLALLMIDLDRFKPVNDRHGHLIGDLVLKAVAHRMSRVLRRGEIRARYGGDEFIAVIEYSTDDEIPRTVARRLIEELSEPMAFEGLTVQIGASVGFAVYPSDAKAEEDLIRKADIALYRAKHEGRGSVRLYDATMITDIDARAKLEEELRAAIQNGDIVPYFQPLIGLEKRELRGFEVLSRWHHPTRGVLQPAEFIPLAESSGQIGALTMVILRAACVASRVLPEHLSIAINVAPQQIEDEWLAPGILAILNETGFPPHRLEVELTEHALVTDLASAKRVISSLKSVGIKIALDDFGTGYSSLCYLSELPFDKIKIDRSFIKTLYEREESAKVVNAIVGLGRSLGVPTIAEGVETEREAAFLREIGCPVAQGFLYSTPVPAAELLDLVAAFSTRIDKRAVA
jgi:diguanylate cyclase (GGDEF)-like protein